MTEDLWDRSDYEVKKLHDVEAERDRLTVALANLGRMCRAKGFVTRQEFEYVTDERASMTADPKGSGDGS